MIKPLLSQKPTLPIGYLRDLPVLSPGDNLNINARVVLINAENDADAVLAFLSEYRDSPTTYKAYSKELERFLLWLESKELAVSAFMPKDWHDYLDFIQKPKPVKLWVGQRAAKFLKSGEVNPNWRVFTGKYIKDLKTKKSKLISFGLEKSSIARAKAVIGALFQYLTNSSYLIQNPTTLGRLHKRINNEAVIKKRVKERIIRIELVEFILDVLLVRKEVAILKNEEAFYPIRARFIISMFINSGLRISELANHKMSDIKRSQLNIDICYLDITGKGGKNREIILDEDALGIIRDYRKEIGLGYTLPSHNEETPLIPRIDKKTTIGLTQLHNIVKESFDYTAKVINFGIIPLSLNSQVKAIIDNDISTLQSASAHWLRHSHATWYQKKHNDIIATKARMGHVDIGTTAIYQHVTDGVHSASSKDAVFVSKVYKMILVEFRKSFDVTSN